MHWASQDAEAKSDFEIHVLSPPSVKDERIAIMEDKGWKRAGFSSLFHKAFVPHVHTQTMTLSVKIHDVDVHANSDIGMGVTQGEYLGWLEWDKHSLCIPAAGTKTLAKLEEWRCASVCGGGRVKDLAINDPYRAFKLQPFVSVAFRLNRYDVDLEYGSRGVGREGEGRDMGASMITPADTGHIYCEGGLVGVSGLPCHIEGPFLHDVIDRCVALPASTLTHRKGVGPLDSASVSAWNAALISTAVELLMEDSLIAVRSTLHPTHPLVDQLFYRSWPFTARMSPQTAALIKKTTLYDTLAAAQLHLTTKGFTDLQSCILPLHTLSVHTRTYLQSSSLPLACCPPQLAGDFELRSVRGLRCLTPTLLREYLKNDA